MNLFIQPSDNISDVASNEWHHFANLSKSEIRARWKEPTGRGLLNSLEARRFSREALDLYVGKFAGKYDLRGIPLTGVDLVGVDLSGIDFFAADLSYANLSKCNLSGSYLSESNVKGAKFDWANLDEVLLDNVEFDSNTHFWGVDLHKVNFTFATLLYDLALSQQRIQQLERHYKYFAWFLRVTCDYGRSFWRYTFWVVGFLFSYAVAYYFVMGGSFIDCLYFSIATFATVGYGDVVPVTIFEKVLVISEIVIGYLMGGLLVGILAKRVIG